MRQNRRKSPWGAALGLILGLIVGTLAGRSLPLAPLDHPLTLVPWQLDLYVVGVRVWVSTNVLGLVGAAVGIILARAL